MTQNINIVEAIELIKKDEAVLIDVREAEEFKAEHIVYALSLPLSYLEHNFKLLNIPSHKSIIFQCARGFRSQEACKKVKELGCSQNRLFSLERGIESWKELNKSVVKSISYKVSLFRQVQIIVGFLIAMSVILGLTGMPLAFLVAGIIGMALFFAGLAGWCGLAIILSKMPWNKQKR